MIWREKKVPLIILGVLLLANTIFFFTYRVQYRSRVREMDDRKAAAIQRLQQVQHQRALGEQQLATYRKTQKDLQSIYNDRWSTQNARLTALINEVKRLAAATDMVPPSYAFGRTDKDKNSAGIDTTLVSVTFTVHGTYQQVRRLINLIELSDQFIIIESVGLGGAAGENAVLTMNLSLKTIFRDTPRGAQKQT